MDEAGFGTASVFNGEVWSTVSLPFPLSLSLALRLLVVDDDPSA